ncbi:TonB-dependent receptor [Maribacter chungangensis]|uniref:TonB-dependent receptor n=1 Tax=Maribacter chungangensis TaxID=1069117 RepID=A0ABW3AZU0_9FLAO
MKTFISGTGCLLMPAPNKYRCRLFFVFCAVLLTFSLTAQEQEVVLFKDSILPIHLNEVIVISSYQKALEHAAHHKPLSTLDEYLESSKKVNMVKRGAYAWEPVLNDMTTERLSITIDGMRIFGACTDRMDPVTSYVDVSNVSDVHVASGQQGSEHGSTIGGALDMRLEKSNFRPLGWVTAIETGFESNNSAQIIGGELNYSGERFYADTDIIYRKAENYLAGGGQEVGFSQFTKYNLSVNSGYKIADGQKLLASFIFDEAVDVGYPALPMDVSLARAFIGSVSWVQDDFIGGLTQWETKLYANSITHIMDDSQRPDVPIRMDMPGWSDTYGYYTQARLLKDNHSFLFKLDGFYNRSLAEMTMYPNNPNENAMFMLTWPDVRTINTGVYAEDVWKLKESTIKISTRLAVQGFNLRDEFGFNSLRIFYPELAQQQTRFLKSVGAQYQKKTDKMDFRGGLSFGDRAPSVSEGFGFYLFNSFDNHDYIGDPNLRNEQALEANAKIAIPVQQLKLGLEGNFFHTRNFIIGEIDPSLSTMTIGADGVKIYNNLAYANLYNVSLDGEYDITPQLQLSGLVSYHRGTDQDGRNLPFISPLAYSATLQYTQQRFTGAFNMRAASDQVNFNPEFGEDRTDAYMVFSLSLGKTFTWNNDNIFVKAGVENIFDEFYSTYTDWNNIPRMGRNVFATVSYAIN